MRFGDPQSMSKHVTDTGAHMDTISILLVYSSLL